MPKRSSVDAWFARYDNPMKDVVLRLRDIILGADPRIDECIKWQAPTFTYEGNLASFFPKSKQHASLMFHQGAKIPGEHPRLEGEGDTSRVMKVASLTAAKAAERDLVRIVRAWCAWRDAAAATKPAKKKAATTVKKKAAATVKKKTAATAKKKAPAKASKAARPRATGSASARSRPR